MSIAPISSMPISSLWGHASLQGSGGYSAADLPPRDSLWVVEIARPELRGQSVRGLLGGVSVLPVGTDRLPLIARGDTSRGAMVVSDRGWIGEPDDPDEPNEPWPARLAAPPTLDYSIPVYPTERRQTEITAGQVSLLNGDGALDDLTGDWALAGLPVVLRRGPYRTPVPARAAEIGRVASLRVLAALSGTSRLTLTLVGAARDLAVPACRTYAGTGGEEGGPDLTDQFRPRLYGHRRSVAPVLVDAAKLIYQINDGPMQEVLGVRNRGVPQVPAGNVGSYAALASAVVADSTYLTCLVTGHVRLGSTPSVLTVDARGAADASLGGYGGGPAALIAVQILRGPGGLSANEVDLSSFSAWPAGEVGMLVTSGTVAEAMERLAAGVGGWWGADAFGRHYGGLLTPPESQGAGVYLEPRMLLAPPEDVGQAQAPWWRARVSYQGYDRVLNGEDIAGSVTAEDRQRFGQSSLTASVVSEGVQASVISSKDGDLVTSVFDGQVHAQALAERLMALFSANRRTWRVRLRAGASGVTPQQLMPGAIVALTWPAIAALAQPRTLIVRRMSARGDDLDLILWG